jgi:signal transduction histidine kinase
MHARVQEADDDVDLVSHMQALAEREKATLARELHDELGGLLVAASMDLAWLDLHVASDQPQEVRRRLDRMKETLAGAVDIKRRIIEELRPTLLDNVGLFAALRWLVDNSCARSELSCTIAFPPEEPQLNGDASIAVFRVAQEGLALIMESPWVRSLTLSLANAGHILTLSIMGTGDARCAPAAQSAPSDSYELATIRHRIVALGGGITFSAERGKVTLWAWIPLEKIQAC